MAVLTAKRIHEGRDGEEESSKTSGAKRYTDVWRVVTDSNLDDAPVVLAAVPAIGAVHPSDWSAYCRRRSARNESFSKRVWIVTLAYSSEYEVVENPLDEPARISWSTQQFTRPYEQDRDGKGLVNAAGDPFVDPPVEGDDSRWAVTVTKNVSSVPAAILSYRNAVNSNAFTIDGVSVGVGQAKIQSISIGETQTRDDISYRVFSYTLHLDDDGWAKQILNRGVRQKVTDPFSGDSAIGPCFNTDGSKATAPVLLRATGNQVTGVPDADDANYITANIYPALAFSVLPMT